MNRVILIAIAIGILNGQQLQIYPINNENGYLISKLNEKYVVQNYTKILHIVNLTNFEKIINIFNKNLNTLESKTNNSNLHFLNREINNLQNQFQKLIPQKTNRHKRGLVNILGTGFKYMIGTMDANDAQEIYSHIENLDKNLRQVTEGSNSQVTVNNNLIKSINDITDHINKEQSLLTNQFNNYIDQINQGLAEIENQQNILQMYADITTIEKYLEKIEDIILLSKLNVLAHDILTDYEIDKYNLTIESFPYVKTTVLFENYLIIFAILIPKFTTERYFHSIIIPIPNTEKLELDVNPTEIIAQGNNIFENTQDYITKQKLKTHTDKCIRNLLKSNNTCPYRFNEVESIELIKENLLITKNLPFSNLSQNCIDQNIPIKGTNIITFNNCKIKINNAEFENKIEKIEETFLFPIVSFNSNKIIQNLTLQKLHTSFIENRKTIKFLEYSHENNFYILISTISTIVIFLIIFAIIKINKCKNKDKHNNQNVNLKFEIEPKINNTKNTLPKIQNITPF